ncbi:MAG: cellulose biosynthesis cyclic di-GMP-binding regulatory protein BcsB [Anaerolineales bacterium]|nr:cellulose biosynthesis cyclic di-GMP-binding regulatory protein BcsB [Anaerolineales bacterium]
MKIKTLIALGFFILLMITPFGVGADPSQLDFQPRTGLEFEITDNRAIFSFEDLRYGERNLFSPIDSKIYIFSTPPNWKFISGGEIDLHYDVLLNGVDLAKITAGGSPYGGNLFVNLNGFLIGSIPFNETGSYTTRLQIPPEALVSNREDGRHLLTISLNAQLSCVYDINALVNIKPTSLFDLPFESSSPALDFSRMPAPFYLESSFIPDGIFVVVADDPDVLELQAAMDVMAGFGSIIDNDYNIELVSIGQLSEADLALYHMIFVGTPDKFDVLSGGAFQLPVVKGQLFNLPQESASDGILQLAHSPWNPNKAIMMVTGNSGESVLKAGQALSSGSVLAYDNPVLAFVSNVQVQSAAPSVVEEFSLKNLGYVTTTMRGIGQKSEEYLFYASKEQVSTKEGYIDLVYYHSGLADYENSSFSIRLNNQEIYSVGFKEETQQVTNLQIRIPPGVLRFGENRFEVRAEMVTVPSCDSTGFRDPWITISDESSIKLPPGLGDDLAPSWLKDLKFFPDLFSTHSNLGDTAFILPKSDPASWRVAGKMAYRLGETVAPVISRLTVAYADDVPQTIRDEYSLIVVGRSSVSPFLVEINDSLPAPFDIESDTANERQMQIVYRVPLGVSVGYLELMSSPFNSEKTVLVVAGNSDIGVGFAGDALLLGELQSQLAGVFAVTNGVQIATGNASGQFSIVGTAVPGSEVIVTTPIPNVTGQPKSVAPPGWLIPLILSSGFIIILVIAFVIKSIMDRRRWMNSISGLKPGDRVELSADDTDENQQ